MSKKQGSATDDLVAQALAGAAGFDEVSTEELFGVPIPYFCCRYFFSSNVIPARKLIMLAGPPGTCKTSLMLEFFRWIIEDGGGAACTHTEEKWPDTLPLGMLGADNVKKLRLAHADTMQEWMTSTSGFVLDTLSKPGLCELPMGIGVDSMCGAQGADRSKKIRKEGAPSRDFSEIARLATDWFPDFSKWMAKTSATAFFLLHLKETGDDLTAPGGKAKDFFSSYTLYLSKPPGRTAKVNATKEGYIEIGMKMHKDSYGPGSTYLPAFMSWEFDDAGVQQFRWRWAETTTKMLETWLGGGDYAVPKSHPFRALMPGFDSKSGGAKGTLYACERIAGGEYLTAREFGEAIETTADVREDLDRMFHITKRKTTTEYWMAQALEADAKEKAKRRGKAKAEKAEKEGDGAKPAVTLTPPGSAPTAPGA